VNLPDLYDGDQPSNRSEKKLLISIFLVETSKTKDDEVITKQTAWTQTVRDRMRQKTGEIQAHRPYEKGVEK
jgi:hypothetical protein